MNRVEFRGVLLKDPHLVKQIGNKESYFDSLLSFPDESDPQAALPIHVLVSNKEHAGLFRQLQRGMELNVIGRLRYQRFLSRTGTYVDTVYVEVSEITQLTDTRER